DLYRAQGREAEAERALRDGLAAMPDSAPLHHALGLSLARSRRVGEGVTELGRAAALSPDDARFAYVYAVALHSAGKRGEALRILERTLARHPGHRDTLVALATINRDAGNRPATPDNARPRAAAHPGDPEPSRRHAAEGWTGPRPAVYIWACSRRSPFERSNACAASHVLPRPCCSPWPS